MGVMTVLVPVRFIAMMGHFIACTLVFWSRGDNVRAGLPLKFTQEQFDRADASCARRPARACGAVGNIWRAPQCCPPPPPPPPPPPFPGRRGSGSARGAARWPPRRAPRGHCFKGVADALAWRCARRLTTALVLCMVFFVVELVGFWSGLTMFVHTHSFMHIVFHVAGCIATCVFIVDGSHFVLFWIYFAFFNALPGVLEVARIVSVALVRKQW